MPPVERLRRIVALLALSLAVVASAGAAEPAGAPRVTLIGDSGLGALLWEKDARERIGRGLDLRTEVRACRKLASDSCWHNGERPPSALETVKSLGRALGPLVVLLVGYNEQPDRYADGLDRVMRAAVDAGAQKVVWVTLRASRPNYVEINREIAAGARRWPQLVVADWDGASRDRDWFQDGVHLTGPGADGFAAFLRPRLLAACGAACAPGGSMLAIRTGTLATARVGTRYAARVVIEGGTTPYRLIVRGLPRPLRITTDGAVTGRPRASGRFRLTVEVTDRAGIRTNGTVALRVVPAA
jgi:hypothetical protein